MKAALYHVFGSGHLIENASNVICCVWDVKLGEVILRLNKSCFINLIIYSVEIYVLVSQSSQNSLV